MSSDACRNAYRVWYAEQIPGLTNPRETFVAGWEAARKDLQAEREAADTLRDAARLEVDVQQGWRAAPQSFDFEGTAKRIDVLQALDNAVAAYDAARAGIGEVP
jgi:hypothetical protein